MVPLIKLLDFVKTPGHLEPLDTEFFFALGSRVVELDFIIEGFEGVSIGELENGSDGWTKFCGEVFWDDGCDRVRLL